jgi:hypothetical protein
MKSALWLNFAWSLLMLAAFGYLAVGSYNNVRGALLLAAATYVAASAVALRGSRWAIATTVVVAVLLLIRWLPVVVVNTWMFISGHELYRDSPGTIFIVAAYAVVFAVPAAIVCTLFYLNGKVLRFMLRSGTISGDA